MRYRSRLVVALEKKERRENLGRWLKAAAVNLVLGALALLLLGTVAVLAGIALGAH